MSVAVIRGYDNRYALSDLWGQAFGDDPQFISDMYACGYLNPSDIFVLTEDGRLIAALFLPEYRIRVNGEDLPIRLLSCVATDPSQRGKGYMSQLISRTLELIRPECCGVCVIPVSQDLYPFYERFGFQTAFYFSEQLFDCDGDVLEELTDLESSLESYYHEYFSKYAKDGFVYKTETRFTQAVCEYRHPTQPCEFFTYSDGFAFLQHTPSEILVREWTGEAPRLGRLLASRYRLPVRIQSPAVTEEKKPVAMLCSFSESLSNFAKEHDLYLNCMYN